MRDNVKKAVACVLGNGVLAAKLYKALRANCRTYREIPKHKKIDYVFYLVKEEEDSTLDEVGKILDFVLLGGAKFLYLLPQTHVSESTQLVFAYEKNKGIDARVVKVPLAIFKEPKDEDEELYFDRCVRKILESMFGQQTSGGLFLLPEPTFAEGLPAKVGEQEKIKSKQRSFKNTFSLRNVIIFFLLSFLTPALFTLVFSTIGFYQLALFQNSFLRGETNRALFFSKIADPSFLIAQTGNNLLATELWLIKKKDTIQNLGILFGAAKHVARSAHHLVNSTILLRASFDGLLAGEVFNSKNAVNAKTELLLAQENLISAELGLLNITTDPPVFTAEFKKLKQNMSRYGNILTKTILFLDVAPQILGVDSRKTYLVLLQNNMELRPTGGFIGSYGLLSFEKGRFLGFDIFDVYSADGQMRGHVEPPAPIKRHLNQPHWFLRDSNWDPDFKTSADKASWFLDKEIGQKVDGVIAMDISLAQLLLSSIKEVTLPDYQEVITKDNLFERAHFYAQGNFFPGSTAKSDFLGSLSRMIFDKLRNDENISWPLIFNNLIRGIEEKHLMFSFNDTAIHNLFSLDNLTGSLFPKREEKEGDLDDFLTVVDSNLGVNKVNYFVKRNIATSITVDEKGALSEVLKITYINQSPNDEYKNYLRIITPSGTRIKKVEFDGQELKEIDTEEDRSKSVFGFLLHIPARSQKIASVTYELGGLMSIAKGLNTYNLRVIKQPGTHEDPLTITINYPSFLNPNDISAPQESRIIKAPKTININSNLKNDREFTIEFLR